jgi:uncharacterized protein (DUF1330 family)
MPAYVIADVEVLDPEPYEEYRRGVPTSLQPYGGRFLTRGGPIEVLEGDWQPKRFVVIEFPSPEQARAWYASEEYQKILPIRLQHARSRIFLAEGT